MTANLRVCAPRKTRPIIRCLALLALAFTIMFSTSRGTTHAAYGAPPVKAEAKAPDVFSIDTEPPAVAKGQKIQRMVELTSVPTKDGSIILLTTDKTKVKLCIGDMAVAWDEGTDKGEKVYYHKVDYKTGQGKFSITLLGVTEGISTTIYACKDNGIRAFGPNVQASAPVDVTTDTGGDSGSGSGSVQPIPINFVPNVNARDMNAPIILGQDFEVKVYVKYPDDSPDRSAPNYLLVDCTDIYRNLLTPLNPDGSAGSWPYRLDTGRSLSATFTIRTTSTIPHKKDHPAADDLASGTAIVTLWAYYKYHDPYKKYDGTGKPDDVKGKSFTQFKSIRIAKFAP